jgi:hypothetical protein
MDREHIEIQPWTVTEIPTQPPTSVYHQANEEQTVVLLPHGEFELRGPHDWTVQTLRGADVNNLADALADAKARWDHADAQHQPEILALIRATERVLGLFPDGTGQ